MNNHNELDQIVESFLSPAPVKESMGLKELFALFEEVEKNSSLLKEIQQTLPQFIPQQEDVLSSDTLKKFNELLSSNKIENPDKELFDKLLREQLDTIVGAETEPLKKLKIFVDYLEIIKKPTSKETDLGKIFAAVVFSTSILSMIREFYSAPSAAGLLYERFIAYFFHGIMPASKEIEDVIVGDEKWSLKLKAEVSISGSIDGMYEFFRKYPDGVVKYLITQKATNLTGIRHFPVAFNFDQFEQLLIRKGQKEKYDKAKKAREVNNLIKAQIKDLQKDIDKGETEIKKINLTLAKQKLEKSLIYQGGESDLQFSFYLTDLKQFLLSEPITMIMTVEDVNNIAKNNSALFNKKINDILLEVNRVADRVKNYLLTGQQDIGSEALDSVENLGIQLNDVIYGEQTE
jgi:hypothetical protein